MQKIILFIFFSCNIFLVAAQITIKGRVLDGRTGLAVVNASVYLNNTSTGTITNKEGGFVLNVKSIYTGELIVSSVGYHTLFYQLSYTNADSNFYTFKLEVKENTLKNILVMNDAQRAEWLKIFKENFLGITEEGDNCRIENLNAVYFTTGQDKNTIYAYADTPLIIDNKLLGYKISFDLIEFSFNKKEGGTYFVGYNRYAEMGDKKRWLKRRKQNYYGSTMHFYRSLISNNLNSEGYTIFEIKKKQLIDTIKVSLETTITKTDTFIAVPSSAVKILFVDSIAGNYYLKTPNKIVVKYNKTPHAAEYLANKVFIQGKDHFGFTSYINLLSDKIRLDKAGIIFDPLLVLYNGFWMYEKVGNQLPFNYYPE